MGGPCGMSVGARTRHNAGMLIIIIAWLYVVILMSMTEHSVIAGVMTFLLYGVLPLSVVVYLLNTPARRARRKAAEAKEGQIQRRMKVRSVRQQSESVENEFTSRL